MPCSDSSSGLNLAIDHQDRLIAFEFAKITCSSEISAQTGLLAFCKGKALDEILALDFPMLVSVLDLHDDEERQFVMYLELDALKAGIAQFLGIDDPRFDPARCRISSVEYSDTAIDIATVILPPKELPKLIPCRSVDGRS